MTLLAFTASSFTACSFILLAVAGLLALLTTKGQRTHPRLPPRIHALKHKFGSIDFYARTWTWHLSHQARLDAFHRSHPANNPYNAHSFNVGRLPVISISGPEARALMFKNPNFALRKGYDILFGSTQPMQETIVGKSDRKGTGQEQGEALVHEAALDRVRLKALVSRSRLARHLHVLISDIRAFVEGLSNSGGFDPHEDIFALELLLTSRVVVAKEVAENKALRHYICSQVAIIIGDMTLMWQWFFWCPLVPCVFRKIKAGASLYIAVRKIVNERRKSGRVEDDALQLMLDAGDNIAQITNFLVIALFAGQLNTGIMGAYLLTQLGLNPDWQAKVLQEIEGLAAQYSTLPLESPLVDRLKDVPLEGWEQARISIACLTETIRISIPGPICRYNAGPDVPIGDYVIPSGSWVTYPLADVHNNPKVHPDPDKFDPSRHLLQNGAKRQSDDLSFVGWGGGRAPCLGMHFARLEVCLTVAHFVAKYDFDVVRNGAEARSAAAPSLKPVDVPRPEMNGLVSASPPRGSKGRVWIRFKERSRPGGDKTANPW